MSDTTRHDDLARSLAEAIHAAYAQQADGTLHPQQEQALLARLAEALRPVVEGGSPGEAVAAGNAALDAWERAAPGIRGPRLAALDPHTRTVRLAGA